MTTIEMVAEWGREAAMRVVKYRRAATENSDTEIQQAFAQMATGSEDTVIGYANNIIHSLQNSKKG